MKIYTKTGDAGTTHLFGSHRVSKSDLRIETYGTLDELSCVIGLVISNLHTSHKTVITDLSTIQLHLYEIMGFLSGAPYTIYHLDDETERIEKTIDSEQATLLPLTSFILPQGSRTAVEIHLARAVCRRAERALIRWLEFEKKNMRPYFPIIRYLNRLSDYFFILARRFNKKKEVVVRLSSRIDK